MTSEPARDGAVERDDADLVITGALMFDGTGAPPQTDVAVLVARERIVAVEARHHDWAPPTGARVIGDAQSTILPGFIDAHVHLCGVDARRADPPTAARAIQQAQRALLTGVTTVRDCGGPGELTIELSAAQREGTWTGPRIVACGPPLTTTGGHCHWMGGRADTGLELRRRVRRVSEAGGDFIKLMLTGGMSTPGSNPYQPQYSIDEAAVAIDDAHRLGMRVAAHVLSPGGMEVAVRSHVDTIEHGWTITGSAQNFRQETVELVAAADHRVIASVTAHRDLRRLLGDAADEDELLRRLTPHRALASLGVPLVVHSDADGHHTRLDEFGRSIEVFRRGMDVSFEAALHAATGLAAEAVGLGDDTGVVQPGRLADIVVVAGDPRREPATLLEPTKVILAGRVVTAQGGLRVGA